MLKRWPGNSNIRSSKRRKGKMAEFRNQIEVDKYLSLLDESVRNRVLKAMNLVKEVHEAPLKEKGLGKYERVWKLHRLKEDCGVIIAYEGTPDKGFVFILPNYRIIAADQWGELLKEFY